MALVNDQQVTEDDIRAEKIGDLFSRAGAAYFSSIATCFRSV